MTAQTQSPTDVQRVDGFGVPAFWLPHNGMASAGILVRSGRGIEPLPLSGITHLISHLIANELGLPPHGAGAYSDLDVTGYSFSGEPEHIQAYLAAYSSLLSSPPLDELPYALGECRAESQQRRPTVTQHLMRLRHGVKGPGALSFEEYALNKAGHKQIQHWAARYLHNTNIAIWFSGPKLDGLKLRLLNGVPIRINPPLMAIPTPGAAYGNPGEVGMSMLVERSQAFGACVQIAEQRARYELIERRGACTNVSFNVSRHGPKHLEVVITADAVDNRDNEVLLTLLWIFEQLATTPPPIEEVDDFRNTIASLFFLPDLADFRAREAAMHHLIGIEQYTWASMYEELNALTPEAVSDTAKEALKTVLAVAPRDCSVLSERFQYVGNWVPKLAEGAHFKPIPRPNEKRVERELIMGKTGITCRVGDYISSVHFAECALVIRQGDFYRELISESGSRVMINGRDWEKGAQLIEIIDRECHPDSTVVVESKDAKGGYTGAERRRWPR